MARYEINKGIGRNPEFKGLKSQYLFLFAGGLLGIFILFVVMYMAGVNQWFCIGIGLFMATALVGGVFHLNARYGEWGLMKLRVQRQIPYYLLNRRRIDKLLVRSEER